MTEPTEITVTHGDREYVDFCANLGKLMTRGLNQLEPHVQQRVQNIVDSGGRLYALVRLNPVRLMGMLQTDDETVMLFELTGDIEPLH